MKKTYIKPQLCVMATATNEHLLYTSWSSSPKGGEPGKDDRGKIIYDEGEGSYEEDDDPWNVKNW